MKTQAKKGFTIVELSLASAFLGILLITIALLVNHIVTIYQKGLTLKSVDTVGEDLIDDFTRSIAASTGQSSLKAGEETTNVYIRSTKNTITAPAYGYFCTGKVSYLWNSGYVLDDGTNYTQSASLTAFNSNSRAHLVISSNSLADREPYQDFHLLRIADPGGSVCANRSGNQFTIDYSSDITELLKSSEDNLALYDLQLFGPTYHKTTQHSFYSGTFILATVRGGVNVMSTGDYCTVDEADNLSGDFSYCAMNKFNFAVRATGASS